METVTYFSLIYFSVVVLIGVLIGLYLIKKNNNNNKVKTDYDERQEAIRGKGFKYAMYTAWTLLIAFMVVDMAGVQLPLENAVIYFGIVIISLVVESSYTLKNEAFLGTNSNVKKYAITYLALTIINILFTVLFIAGGVMIEDGILTSRFINAECAIAFVILTAEYFAVYMKADKDSEEEEDEES